MKKSEKLLRNTSWYLLLLFTMFISTRCSLLCNDEEKMLFDPYDHPLIQEGDTLLFVCNINIDSFIVSKSYLYKPYEIEERDYASYESRIVQLNCIDTCVILDISIMYKLYTTYYLFPFKDEYTPNMSSSFVSEKFGEYSLTIGGHKLTGLYKTIFKKDQYNLFCEIDSALYSKTYGFVKYFHYTGEEFVLSEGSLAMLMARE